MDFWFLSAAAGSIGQQILSDTDCSCHLCGEIISRDSSFTSRSSQKRKLSQDEVIDAGDYNQMEDITEDSAASRLLDQNCSCFIDVSKVSGRCRSHLQIKHLHKSSTKPLTSMDISMLAHFYNEQDVPRNRFPSPIRSYKSFNVLHRADLSIVDSLKTLPKLELESTKPITGVVPGKRTCQRGPNAASRFSMGMCAGILSSFAAARKEIDELRSSLKQAEQLVQDLQEELEMKDSLTVRELKTENNAVDAGTRPDAAEDPSASMSKIEAELEAELERLGLNMGTSQEKDAYPSVTNGEFSGHSETSSFDSLNYAVSPTELCIRLHEVANEQLEERVRELEAALEKKSHPTVVNESDSDVSPFDWFDRMSCELDGTDVSGALSVVDNFLEDDVTPVEDDVDEKELIKLLVEKTKKGSPLVLNAQRILFSV